MRTTVRSLRAFSLVARIGAALLLGSGAIGCGEGEPGDELDEESRAIANGTTVSSNSWGVVAIYHQNENTSSSTWFPRPCTGIVLNPSTGWESVILTARHCVTPDANPNQGVDGPPLSAARLRVTAELAPGPAPPPPSAVTPCNIAVPPSPNNGYLDLDETLDLALVFVCTPIPGLSAVSIPLYMSSTGDLDGDALSMYGYGCFVGADSSTSGVLRTSTGHHITGFDTFNAGETGYDYNGFKFSDGTNSTYLLHGDSGGPSFWQASNSFSVQIGVHDSGGAAGGKSWDTAVSRITTQWIQSRIGRLYIRPHNAMTRALTRSSLNNGASVSTATTSSVQSTVAVSQYFEYEFSTRHIRAPDSVDGTTCLKRNSDNTVVMQTCTTYTSQKWWVTDENTIRTHDPSLCLQRQSDNTVIVAQCSDTNKAQKWYFDFDSKVSGVW